MGRSMRPRLLLPAIGSSQFQRSTVEPSNRPKKSFCKRSVIGPRLPSPTVILSTERTGVISAAVPVRKTSSAM